MVAAIGVGKVGERAFRLSRVLPGGDLPGAWVQGLVTAHPDGQVFGVFAPSGGDRH